MWGEAGGSPDRMSEARKERTHLTNIYESWLRRKLHGGYCATKKHLVGGCTHGSLPDSPARVPDIIYVLESAIEEEHSKGLTVTG